MEALGQIFYPPPPPMAELLHDFDVHLERCVAVRTRGGYLSEVKLSLAEIEEHQGRPVSLADLTVDVLQQHIDRLRQRYKEATVQRRGSSLRRLIGYAAGIRNLCANIGEHLILPKVPQRLPKVLTAEEAQRLLNAPTLGKSARQITVFDLRDAAMIALIEAAGPRAGEVEVIDVTSLQWEGEDLIIPVIGKGNKERLLAVAEGTATEAIKRYLERRHEINGAADCPALFLNWWGMRLQRGGVHRVVARWAKRAGIARKVGPHSLRHTFITRLIEACGERIRGVQALAGHESPKTTTGYDRMNILRLLRTARNHPQATPSFVQVGSRALELARDVGRAAWAQGRKWWAGRRVTGASGNASPGAA